MPLFKSKLGLIAATVGSAVGLGTVWRFPAETQANGGAAFLLIYIACAFLIGMPLMQAEFALGRGTRQDAVGAFRHLSPDRPWWLVGAVAVLASFLILIFYLVVGAWTLEYLVASATGYLYEGLDAAMATSARDAYFTDIKNELVATSWAPLVATLVFIVVNIGVLLAGVQKGIERMSNIMMPMLFVLLVAFCCVTLSLPGAGEGVRFFLTPDFTKITPAVCINALGQALFSLSLGMGILVTYSSYYPDNTKLGRTSFTVVAMTLMVALLMGLLIFPAVASFGLSDHELSGTTLVFVTLPEVFARLPLTGLWSTLFFLLLLVAALTSTVSIAEVTISFMLKRFKISRKRAVWLVLCPTFLLSGVCSLSFGLLSDYTLCGMVMFDFLDTLTNNYLLPAVAFGTCLYMGWFAPRGFLRSQLTNSGTLGAPTASASMAIVRFIAPAAILAIMISYLI